MKDLFNELRAINVNAHTEQVRQGNVSLTYLSWAWAVDTVSKDHDFSYEIKWFDGKPYLRDENLGYMVFTQVTIDGITKEMWLPVMDSHNKAMKDHPYEFKTLRGTFTVPACTMFDINKSIMRCLTKNLAMFGLGLYIYAGEDLPDVESEGSLVEEIAEMYKKYGASNTFKTFLRTALDTAGVKKVSELKENDLKALKALIDASMKQIETEVFSFVYNDD